MIYDVAIIGGGIAGITASIYTKRALLSSILLEKGNFGGQILLSPMIDNYTGFPAITGIDLSEQFYQHLKQTNISIETDTVCEIKNDIIKTIKLESGKYISCRTIIYAAGATHKQLGIDGEQQFIGSGVSYCATCDGAFFKRKTSAVIGGGDTAAKEALYLSRICKKVYLIHRRYALRASAFLQQAIANTPNIYIQYGTQPISIQGEQHVQNLIITEEKTKVQTTLPVDAVFIAIGMQPQTALLKEICDLDSSGYVIAEENTKTSAKGIFAAGDVRTKSFRQLITAASDGAYAAYAAEQYLQEQK